MIFTCKAIPFICLLWLTYFLFRLLCLFCLLVWVVHPQLCWTDVVAISILVLYMILKKSRSIALNFYAISRELFMYDFKEIYVYIQAFLGFLFLKQWCVLSNTFMHRMGRVHLFICWWRVGYLLALPVELIIHIVGGNLLTWTAIFMWSVF